MSVKITTSEPVFKEPDYIKIYPVRDARIDLERVWVGNAPRVRGALFRTVLPVTDPATGERIFAIERWGERTALLEAVGRAKRMGLKITAGSNGK